MQYKNLSKINSIKNIPSNTKIVAITILLTFALISSISLIPTISAHKPAWEIPSYAYVVASPNPVGVNQNVAILMWVDYPMPQATVDNDVRRHNYTLTIIEPNGNTLTEKWDIVQDTTGVQYYLFKPTQVGTYTLNFNYPEQVYTWADTKAMKTWTNDVFLTANATATFTVQADPLPEAITGYPLPTEYWTRPIEGQNTNWWNIASNWLNSPQIDEFVFQKSGLAPNSAHIMWTKPLQDGGVVGGNNIGLSGETYYTGETYQVRFNEPIIMHGRLYYELPFAMDASGGGYICVDLRTGEEIWYNQNLAQQRYGQIPDYQDGNQHGALSNGFLWEWTGRGGSIWNATDPLTGEHILDITDVPDGYDVYSPNGDIVRYQLNSEGKWLACWSSAVILEAVSGRRGIRNEVRNASESFLWNLTIPELPAGEWNIERAVYNDFIFLTQGTGRNQPGFGGRDEINPGANITVLSLQDSSVNLLWTKHFPAPPGNVSRILGVMDSTTRVFVFRDMETLNLWGYSIDSGDLLWGPKQISSSSWEYFPSSKYTYAAYGNLYTAGLDGVLECFDITTGDLKWTYGNGELGNSTSSGFQTVYGNYPLYVGAIADGKIYLFTSEHSPNSPLFKGARIRCLNAHTGEEIWTMESWVTTSGGGAATLNPCLAVASGYLVYLNGYDLQIYCIGKGPTELTTSIQNNVISLGNPALITGSIMDIAAGTKQNEQASRFPQGVPAVSDEDMNRWMEYVYMQKPKPEDVTGVPVKLAYQLPDGSWKDIEQVISDDHGNYGFAWTPEEEGTYVVKAFFLGSESYWGSSDTTYLTVGPAEKQVDVPTVEEIAADTAQRTIAMLPPYPDVPTQEQIADDAARRTIAMLPQYPTPYPPAEIPAYQTIDIVILALVVVAIIIGIYLIIKKK